MSVEILKIVRMEQINEIFFYRELGTILKNESFISYISKYKFDPL